MHGIILSVPSKGKGKNRTVLLRYDKLDALWETRQSVWDRLSVRDPFDATIGAVWQKRGLKVDNTNEAQYWAVVSERQRRELDGLSDEAADQDGYDPQKSEWRREIERQIRERRGQAQFRDALRHRYGDRCLVTSCAVLAVLEAAHIKPYRGERDNHPDNGLLLRADVHTLFDLDLLHVEPGSLRVELHPSIANEYAQIAGKQLGLGSAHPPSKPSLKERYKKFQQKLPKGWSFRGLTARV
jgi:hypothetical protein